MVSPEKWDRLEGPILAEDVRGNCVPLLRCVRPVLDAEVSPQANVEPARNIAGCPDPRSGLAVLIAHHAIRHVEPTAGQPAGARRTTNCDEHNLGSEDTAVSELNGAHRLPGSRSP